MNRRTLLRTAGAAGSLAVAGCLETDAEPTPAADSEEGPPRYGRPAYSRWPPAAGHDGGGVVSYHLELPHLPAIQQAVSAGRLDSTRPLVGLPLSALDQLTTAVESLSPYPFGGALRQAVNTAGESDATDDDSEPVVEPPTEPIVPTTESTAELSGNDTDLGSETVVDPRNQTMVDQHNETGVDRGNETVVDPRNETMVGDDPTNETVDDLPPNASNVTAEPTDPAADPDPDPVTAAELGIEVDALTLTADLLVFEGSFDRAEIVDRFGADFEQVDTHRGVSIYEGSDEMAGFAFALDGSRLLVPTVDDDRTVEGETVLAHTLSGYISTVGRIADVADGEWLFETTGPAPLAVGFWETPAVDRLAGTAVAADRPGVGAVFESVGSCLSAIAVTDDGFGRSFDARFSGLYPDGPPSDEELESALVGDVDGATVYTEPPRVHVTTPLGEQR